jgi:hypothetical protein
MKASDYQKTLPPTMTPEKRAIYEILNLLETHVNKSQPPFSVGYISSIKNSSTVDLKRKKIEGQIYGGPATSANGVLILMDELYTEAVDKEIAVTTKEELECDGNEAVQEVSMELQSNAKKSKSSKKTMEPYAKMGEDSSSLELEILCVKNIVEVRAELARRTKERNVLRQCIVNYLGKEQDNSSVSLVTSSEHMGSWQRFVRRNKNNLHLT